MQLYLLLGCFLRQPISLALYNRKFSVLCTVFTFLILSFVNSMLSTNSMLNKQPFLIERLEDILDSRARGIRPMFLEYGYARYIYDNDRSSLGDRFRERVDSYGIEKCIIKYNPAQMASSFEFRDFAAIVPDAFDQPIHRFSCANLLEFNHIYRSKTSLQENLYTYLVGDLTQTKQMLLDLM